MSHLHKAVGVNKRFRISGQQASDAVISGKALAPFRAG